uniref:F-box domain-containing protein n=1 Tax=Kalanchoe fedtschenkoi TaxID=63787 RepID=A0A7N0UZF0_KALFE
MESIPELVDDLVRLILLKLPIKSLIKFRSVSKSWKYIISNNTFIYELYSNNSLALSEGKDDDTPSFLTVHRHLTPNVDKYFSLLSLFRTDGRLNSRIDEVFHIPYITNKSPDCPLIYPAGFGIHCLFEFSSGKVALWNLAIKELKALPLSPFKAEYSDGQYHYGFAHVSFKDGIFSYKVGKMTTRWDEEDSVFWLTIELYSSIDDSWKVLRDCRRLKVGGDTGTFHNWIFSGANLNDTFHCLNWLCAEDPHIFTFDMGTGEFGRFELPNFVKHDSRYEICFSLLTKFDEKFLCLLLYWNNEEEINVDVWVMLEYGIAASWTKKSTTGPIINLDPIEVLGISKRAGVLFLDMEKGLSFCRLGSQKLGLGHQNSDKFHQVVENKESLVSFSGTSDSRKKL